MRTILFGATLVLFTSAIGGCVIKDNDDGGDGTTGSQSSGAGAAGSTGSQTTSGSGSTGSSGSSTSSSSGSGGGPLGSCDTATLLIGDPFFDGDFEGWVPAGQPAVGDPPIRNRHLATASGHVYVDTQSEIWFTDGSQIKRSAGDELEPELQYKPSGSCAESRFMAVAGIAALPNGHLVVADTTGGGLVELTDPAGACTAAPIAGNQEQTFHTDIDEVGNPGDVDGPGASAKFYGVSNPTADADGNVYVIDRGNSKIKKIGNDAARTVTTLFDYASADEKNPLAMTVMNGKLYVTGATAVKDFLWELDTATPGDPNVIYETTGVFAEVGNNALANLFALDNDGQNLIAGSNKGYIFRISPAGQELGVVAGMGQIVDFPTADELDVTQPIPTASLPLKGYAINDGSIVRDGSDVLWAGQGGNGLGFHVFSIHCN